MRDYVSSFSPLGNCGSDADACEDDPKTLARADEPVIDVYRIGGDGTKCELSLERCEP